MKEKKLYETPHFSVTQIVTEGVFAASGKEIPLDTKSRVSINYQEGYEAFDNGEIEIGSWE